MALNLQQCVVGSQCENAPNFRVKSAAFLTATGTFGPDVTLKFDEQVNHFMQERLLRDGPAIKLWIYPDSSDYRALTEPFNEGTSEVFTGIPKHRQRLQRGGNRDSRRTMSVEEQLIEFPVHPLKVVLRRNYILDRTAKNLRPIINEHVHGWAQVMTDDATVYPFVLKGQVASHDVVCHSKEEYSRKENGKNIHTNTVEGFFSILKRGIVGTFHHVSKQHLNRYLNEFDFRYNARDTTDGERAELAVKGVVGKRLMHRDSSVKA